MEIRRLNKNIIVTTILKVIGKTVYSKKTTSIEELSGHQNKRISTFQYVVKFVECRQEWLQR